MVLKTLADLAHLKLDKPSSVARVPGLCMVTLSNDRIRVPFQGWVP